MYRPGSASANKQRRKHEKVFLDINYVRNLKLLGDPPSHILTCNDFLKYDTLSKILNVTKIQNETSAFG
jgi:hypothetical protein